MGKKQYFTHNLKVNKMNPRKTWILIDDLSSRKYGRVRNIFLQLLDQFWQVKYSRQP